MKLSGRLISICEMAVGKSPRKIFGFTDEVTTCERCGKNPLRGTYAFEDENGNICYYGSECINKQFGISDEKIKSLSAKEELIKDQKFLGAVWELQSRDLLNAILKKNNVRDRFDDVKIKKFIGKYLEDRFDLYKELIQPYPNLRKKYEKSTPLDTEEDIIKKIEAAKRSYERTNSNPTISNSNNTVF